MKESLDYIERSVDKIALSRKDTFKEQIAKAYHRKQEQVQHYKDKAKLRKAHENLYQDVVNERDQLRIQNEHLMEQLAKL